MIGKTVIIFIVAFAAGYVVAGIKNEAMGKRKQKEDKKEKKQSEMLN